MKYLIKQIQSFLFHYWILPSKIETTEGNIRKRQKDDVGKISQEK